MATNTPPGRAALAMLDYAALTFTYPCSRVHGAGATARNMDQILEAVYREVVRFHSEFCDRAQITEPEWRGIQRRWPTARGWMSMRQARRLMLQRRAHLRRAISNARSRTALLALVALAGSGIRFPVEWAYRFRRRPWFRRLRLGELGLVFPDKA